MLLSDAEEERDGETSEADSVPGREPAAAMVSAEAMSRCSAGVKGPGVWAGAGVFPGRQTEATETS